MLLALSDAQSFYKLHRALMFFVNQRLRVLPDQPATPEDFGTLSPQKRLKVRDALVAKLDLIESFVKQNPAQLSRDELEIVLSWRHQVAGKFYIFRELQKYTVFLSMDGPPVAYGVMGLTQPFDELVGPNWPVMTDAVLLPFNDKIVYDGLLMSYRISFGPGIRRSMNESFKEAKERYGIVTSLPVSAKPIVPTNAPQDRPRPRPNPKEETAEVLAVITALIDQFCLENLNDEYAVLCRKLAEKLARKRPSPLLSGKANTWACGIVRTVGWANFLHDKSQTPHMPLIDIDARFGISESSGAAKLAAIRKMLKIGQFNHEWTLPSRMDDNPLIWMLEISGFTMDIRHAPREVQEAAFEKGLIPYIPADR